eukprot:5187536-Amphidinium_carterae.1
MYISEGFFGEGSPTGAHLSISISRPSFVGAAGMSGYLVYVDDGDGGDIDNLIYNGPKRVLSDQRVISEEQQIPPTSSIVECSSQHAYSWIGLPELDFSEFRGVASTFSYTWEPKLLDGSTALTAGATYRFQAEHHHHLSYFEA